VCLEWLLVRFLIRPGAPDTLILNRNGPDPTDTGVTIVLERGNAPVSLNGHPIHEEEKRKLLDLKFSEHFIGFNILRFYLFGR
jgi:hypothetical protein